MSQATATTSDKRTTYLRLLIVDVEVWGKDAGKPKRLTIKAVDEAGNRRDWAMFPEAAGEVVKKPFVNQGFAFIVGAILKPDLFPKIKGVLASGDKAKMQELLVNEILPMGQKTAEDLLTGDDAIGAKRMADLKSKLVGCVVLVSQYSRGMSEPDAKGRSYENWAVAAYDTRNPEKLPNPFVCIMPNNAGGAKPEQFGGHNREEYVATGAWKGFTAEMIAKESAEALTNPEAFIAAPAPRTAQTAKAAVPATANVPADEVPIA